MASALSLILFCLSNLVLLFHLTEVLPLTSGGINHSNFMKLCQKTTQNFLTFTVQVDGFESAHILIAKTTRFSRLYSLSLTLLHHSNHFASY